MKPAACRLLREHDLKLLFSLAVFVGIVFFTLLTTSVVVKNTVGNSKSFAAAGDTASLTFSWSRPGGYAGFIDSGGKQAFCYGSGNSCSVGANTYWPGSPLIYNVKVKDRTGTVFYSSSTPGAPSVAAKSDGSATVTWPLIGDYAWVAYPSGSTCAADTSVCDLGDVNGDTSSSITRTTAAKLKYSTSYTIDVCTPNCGTGFLFYSTSQTTPAPAPACTLSTGTIVAGQSMSVGSINGLVGPIQMLGAYVDPNVTPSVNIGTLAVPYSTVTIPASTAGGLYVVRVAYNGYPYTCKTAQGGDLSVTAAPAACVFSPTTIYAGSAIGIIPNSGFTIDPIPVNLIGTVFGNKVAVNSIPKSGGSVTVPAGTGGVFYVVLGNTGATTTCTGSFGGITTGALTVNPLPALTCATVDVNGDGVINGGDQLMIQRNYSPPGTYNAKYDLNRDNIVDASDYYIVLSPTYYNKICRALPQPPVVACASQTTGNVVNVTFNWTPANFDPGIKTQWLDYDTSDHGTAGTWPATLARNYAPGVNTSGVISGRMQTTTYYWRVNTQMSDNSWVSSSPIRQFTTPNCAPIPVLACATVDVNGDGMINGGDSLAIQRNYAPPGVYNAKYDLNRDNIVDASDYYIVISPTYANKICRALPQPPVIACASQTTGNVVNVTFNWTPANFDPGIKTQWLDYDTSDHGTAGTWPATLARNYAPGVNTSGVISGRMQATTYYWRVNTQMSDGSWVSSSPIRQFPTPTCAPAPTNLVIAPATADKLSDGTPCAYEPYTIASSWQNINNGTGWYMDISQDSTFNTFSNKKIDGIANNYFWSSGADFSPALSFAPNQTYYWRIYYGVLNTWYPGKLVSFSVAPCATGSSALNYYIRYGDTSISPTNPEAIKNYIRSNFGGRNIDSDCGGVTCWDYIVNHSIQDGISPAFTITILIHEGTSMGFVSGGAATCSTGMPINYGCFKTFYLAHPFDTNHQYDSYHDWILYFCGAGNVTATYPLCSQNQGEFVYGVKAYYQVVAPGKLIQL